MHEYKKFAVSKASTLPLKGAEQSRTYLYHLKTRTPYSRKVASPTGTNVIGWIVMISILENQAEHLGRDIKNTT